MEASASCARVRCVPLERWLRACRRSGDYAGDGGGLHTILRGAGGGGSAGVLGDQGVAGAIEQIPVDIEVRGAVRQATGGSYIYRRTRGRGG